MFHAHVPCRCGYLSFVVFIIPSTFSQINRVVWAHFNFLRPRRKSPLLPSFLQRAVERVVENVAQREQAYEVAALVDHDEAVHARFADRVEDGVEAVIECASVDAGEVLGKLKLVMALNVWQ